MATIISFIIFLLICVSYGLSRNYGKREDIVFSAYAGSSDEPHNDAFVNPISKEKAQVIQLPDGKYASTRKFHRIRVDGVCMKPYGINDGEEWLATKFNQKETLESQIKIGDVILIYLEDTNRYKIRRVKEFKDSNTLDTYSYDKDGCEHKSKYPHKKSAVMGIVKYRLNIPA